MANSNLNAAKKAKNDEFYTQSSDIEEELRHYTKHFKDKVVYCNCDDPTWSNFWHYFYRSFGYLGLKKLISTHYDMDGSSSYALIYEGGYDNADDFNEGVTKVPLKGDGDFRSDECIEYLKESDIVVTNPPFSLAREYVKQLMDNKKDFLIIGNKNWITYKEVFPLLMNRKMWIGASQPQIFDTPDGKTKKVAGLTRWFTNLSLQKSTDQMVIWKSFDQKEYPAYDNYAAFECSKVVNIPKDTEITAIIDKDNLQGWKDTYQDDLTVVSTNDKTIDVKIDRPIWGVPITFLDKYNPSSKNAQHNLGKEFNIVGFSQGSLFTQTGGWGASKQFVDDYYAHGGKGSISVGWPHTVLYVHGIPKIPYQRIFIRAKKGVKF